ncbi:hypothetical protein [Rhizobium phage RHph_X2_26]|nr:hypothetical protein [Rhizobium phage RHph_X2_26]
MLSALRKRLDRAPYVCPVASPETEKESTVDHTPDKNQLTQQHSATVLEARRRVVFKEGRDLNIHNVVKINLDGSWWRIWDEEGRFFLIDPNKVNYVEVK